jgi:DNA-dependent RNA polymerase auxiliary subunit epsilon
MLFKVFYQETKTRSPKREQTKTMFLDMDVDSAEAGVIAIRQLIADKTPYQLEFIDPISAEQEAYERESDSFEITSL